MATPTHVAPTKVMVLKDLGAETYENWKACMMAYMEAQDLWDDVMDGTNIDPDEQIYQNKDWRKKNGAALLAIKTSCAPEILSMVRDERSAKVAWDTLEAEIKQQQPQQQQQMLENNNLSLSQPHQEALQFPDVPWLSMDSTALPQYHIPINYEDWSIHMKRYLIHQDVWCGIVELVFPNYDEANDFSGGDEPNNGNDQVMMDYYKTWRDKNSKALRAIQDACAPNIPPQIAGLTSAKLAWETLAKLDKFKQRGISLTDPRYSNPDLDVNFGDYISETAADPPTTWEYQPLFGTSLLFYKPKGYEPLISAIGKGDWGVISGFIQSDPTILASIISYNGNTPIHEAAAACQTEIARRMVQEMSEQDLGIQSSDGYTPLHLAASFGSIAIARFLVQKNQKLVQIRNVKGVVPVTMASILGKKDTTLYLYNCTPIELLYPESGDSGFLLLKFCIANRMLDIALDLLRKCPRLSFGREGQSADKSPIMILATCPSAFYSGCQLRFWERWIYSCTHIQRPVVPFRPPPLHIFWNSLPIITRGIKRIPEMKLNHIYAMEFIRCICKEIPTRDLSQFTDPKLGYTFLTAVQNGIEEMVIEILKAYPKGATTVEDDGRDLKMLTIAFRQEKIFNLMLQGRLNINDSKMWDYDDNNVLHWAGKPPPPVQLARISGAALQMQRELQWFKAVESIVPPSLLENFNKEGHTPRQAFTKYHKELRDDGEKWMKETASSCTVVGALIITIMFAAAFTVPGGNFQDSGHPIFGREKAFITFIVSDAIALFSSSTSVLMFLGILTSRYAEDDFLMSLPRKLIIGLSSLFMSIVAMMIAFCATIIIMLRGRLSVIVPVCLLAGIPVFLFMALQFPLLVEIFNSTYFGIFSKKKKAKYKLE